jgi:hypothetical protein
VKCRAAPLVGAPLAVVLSPLVLAACGDGNDVTSFSETPTTVRGVSLAEEPSPVGRILATGSGYTL